MTTAHEHVDPAVIAELFEGGLSGAAAAEARAKIAACPHCAGQLEDLTTLARLTSRGDGTTVGGVMDHTTLSPSLDRAFEDVIMRSTRARPSSRRPWYSIAAAAAAIVFVVVLVQRGSGSPEEPLVRGSAVLQAAPSGQRADAAESLHFELEVRAPVYLAIFRVVGNTVDVVYPDPNPALGTYGRTSPFEPGPARIPPSPVADLPMSRAAERPAFFAAASKTPIDAQALAAALQAAKSAGPGGTAAVRDALARRFEAIIPLEVR